MLAQELSNTRARATHFPVIVERDLCPVLFAFNLLGGSIMLSRLRVAILAVKGGGVKVRYSPLPGCDSEKLGLCLAVSVMS